MADSMDPALVEAVRRDIYSALAKTSPSSTLPPAEQDALLAQACAEACDVLGRWLASTSWEALRPSALAGPRPLAEAVASWEQMRPFLSPVRDALHRVSAAERDAGAPPDPGAYVDGLIKSATYTARRQRRLTRQDLYQEADVRLRNLREQSCQVASDFKADAAQRARAGAEAAARRDGDEKRHARRALARKVLGTVATTLLTLTLAMASASPAAVRSNMPAWGHDAAQVVASAEVLLVHNVAHAAAPGVSIAPPRLGPRVR